MGCEDVRDLLAIYVGGECRDEDAETVEAHVALCGPCARELDLYREARAALSSLAQEPAPPGLGKAIWAGVRDEVFPRPRRARGVWLDEVLRCAALLMLGLGLGVLIHSARRPGEAPAAVASSERSLPAEFRPVGREVRPMPLPRGTLADPEFYLPRAEAFPADGAKDF